MSDAVLTQSTAVLSGFAGTNAASAPRSLPSAAGNGDTHSLQTGHEKQDPRKGLCYLF